MASSLFPQHAKTPQPQIIKQFEQFKKTLSGDPKAMFNTAMQTNPQFHAFVDQFQANNPRFRS